MNNAPHILMCPADHYGIEYEINPWMSRSRQADRELAQQQWRDLKALLEQVGATISLLEPVAGLPDLVFTANAAMIYRDRAILAHFRHEQRQGEEPLCDRWLSSHGFRVEKLPDGRYFEGAGDALFCGATLLAGYRIRSDIHSQQLVGKLVDSHVIPVELVDNHYYHLDTCCCPLAAGEAIWFPGAFDDYGRQAIRQAVPKLIEVSAEEAHSFACNAVVVGKHVVTNTGCPQLHRNLRAAGYTPHETPLSEFVKAGGSAKCLTLRLDGEEAASWKNAA
ncbi:N(G),N(G)-dimethylarginine dimethylaminohydrolase [Anatilimnocola aggregata]|uniref:N(G),N(G)-dimethylarginine dimethylaminohydrolase n=1 Tax=Anatilimnocola aggregata TaxID=2528021 RepID=A0A517YCW4_9BACT|nr:arginine deiminase-related protein [Anatilimnocola aggregata]QDU28086.1 N(G),N(G)-dimethylarginine dimethylaminohydrolase [Anatilimnocola aggregata]